jgi:hypothetical protein
LIFDFRFLIWGQKASIDVRFLSPTKERIMSTQSGQKVVAAAGTEEALGSTLVNAPVLVKALTTNTGLVYLGNVDGAVDSATGLPLVAGDVMIFNFVGNLSSILVDADVNGEGVAWITLEM